MKKCLLRIEGVNLAAVLGDTDQVSVTRGASFLLRAASRDLPQMLKVRHPELSLQPISVGASVGLYECVCGDPTALADAARELFRDDPIFRHFTFVVDAIEAGDEMTFPADRECLVAANRWQQMLSPSLSLVDLDARSSSPCDWNGIRPANVTEGTPKRDGKTLSLAASVFARFKAGRELRQEFYGQEAGPEFESWQFCDDLDSLSRDKAHGNLSGKVAVIYLDGNRFGEIQRAHCGTAQSQREFDEAVQGLRNTYLANFLRYAAGSRAYLTDKGQLRIETLMWGGDEILLVVPAWCGLDALTFFYDACHNWCFAGERLTHAGGLVFANHKTPLYRLVDLAKKLADDVKDQCKGKAPSNAYNYAVLESIDYPTESLDRFRQAIFGNLATTRRALIPPQCDAVTAAAALHELPRGQIYALARAAVADGDLGLRAEARLKRLKAMATQPVFDAALDAATKLFAGIDGPATEAWTWLHAVELWDYLPVAEEAIS